MLCEDGYEHHDRSVTLVAIANHNGRDDLVGTLRLVFGKDDNSADGCLPALDAMNFIDFTAKWPHQAVGIPDSKVGELGRYTIVDTDNNFSAQDKTKITGALIKKALNIASLRGLEYIYAIMPNSVSRIVNNAGIKTECFNDIRFRKNNPCVKHVFERFPLYWKNSPRLYRFW